jgi:hypothetical protein
MPEPGDKTELMRSLRGLVRGLAVLFWALPATLLICFLIALENDLGEVLERLGVIPPLVGNALLFYGLWQVAIFQRDERPWQRVLDRCKLLALINTGLAPFLFWWHRMPGEMVFQISVAVLAVSGAMFLFNLNFALHQLAAMLPDQTLRGEARLFTRLNLGMMAAVLVLMTAFFALLQFADGPHAPVFLVIVRDAIADGRRFLLVFMVLLPLALTMSLIWKTKETILNGIFHETA